MPKVKKTKYLEYVTRRDGKVRYEHTILDGITRPFDDNFWLTYSPPNGWYCRCTLKTIFSDEDIKTDVSTRGLKFHLYKAVPNVFRFNAAVEKTVFSPKHPYFKVPKKDKAWAKKNFGLPLPKKRKLK